jgi:glutamate/tyrosine decarboxylase-like PLP-dependent enzyme
VDGITSVSVDTHKYAYAPKGTSVLLHRSSALRRPQYFASADWPGYTMINSTMQSTKSGGPLAGAWAVLQTLGDAGYQQLAAETFEAVDRIVAGVAGLPGLHVLAAPDSTLVALATDARCDAFTICDEMLARGWYVQPQMSYAGAPPTVHLSVSAATLAHVEEFLTALGQAVDAAVAAGPVVVDAGVVAFIGALDPGALSDEDFDGLLAASGLVGESADGGLALPTRMAEINAMLDLAAPAMREALLIAFLDRLAQPVRG